MLGDIIIKIKADISKLTEAYNKAKEETKNLKDRLEGIGDTLKSVGLKLTAGFGAVAGMFALAIKTGADFEQAMRNVQSVAGATEDEFKQLWDYAKKMGETTIFSASEAAQAMYYLASAGYNANQIMGSLNGILDLAAATQTDLAFATETVVSTLTMFGMSANEASTIADKFAATISSSQATMEKLAYSLRYAGPLFKSLGYSIDELLVALGGLYNAGYRGEQAGTILRGALSSLLDPSREVLETISRLNLQIYELTPTAQEIYNEFIRQSEALRELQEEYEKTIDAMSRMNEEMSKLADEEAKLRLQIRKIRLKAMKEGRELTEAEKKQIKELQIRIEELSIKQDELRLKYKELQKTEKDQKEQLKEMTKAVEELAKKFAESPKKLKDFKTLMEEFKKSGMTTADAIRIFGQEAGPGMMALIQQWGTPALEMLEQKIKNASGTAQKMAEIQLNSVSGGLKELKSAIEGIQIDVFEAIRDDLVDFLKELKKHMPDIKEFTKVFVDEFIPALKTLVSAITPLLKEFNKLPKPVKENIARFLALSAVFAMIAGPALMLTGQIIQVVGAFMQLKAFLAGAGLAAKFAGIAQGLGVLRFAFVGLTGPIGIAIVAIGLFALAWHQNWFGIRDKTKEAIKFLQEKFEELKKGLESLVSKFEEFKESATEKFNDFKNKVLGAWKTITTTLEQKAKEVKDSVAAHLQTLADKAYNYAIQILTRLIIGFNEKMENIRSKAGEIKHIIEGAINLAGRAFEWGKNLLQSFTDGIKQKIKLLEDVLDKIAKKVKDYLGIYSPAKRGPLKDLPKWGPNLVKTFAEGIQKSKSLMDNVLSDLIDPFKPVVKTLLYLRPILPEIPKLATALDLYVNPIIPRASVASKNVTNNINLSVNISSVVIREEADINRLADVLVDKVNRKLGELL